jgi:hypothetical protein
MWKSMIGPDSDRWQYRTAHAHCMLDNWAYEHTLGIFKYPLFPSNASYANAPQRYAYTHMVCLVLFLCSVLSFPTSWPRLNHLKLQCSCPEKLDHISDTLKWAPKFISMCCHVLAARVNSSKVLFIPFLCISLPIAIFPFSCILLPMRTCLLIYNRLCSSAILLCQVTPGWPTLPLNNKVQDGQICHWATNSMMTNIVTEQQGTGWPTLPLNNKVWDGQHCHWTTKYRMSNIATLQQDTAWPTLPLNNKVQDGQNDKWLCHSWTDVFILHGPISATYFRLLFFYKLFCVFKYFLWTSAALCLR